MRKDVEQLGSIYRPDGAGNRSDIEILWWPNAKDVAARYEVLLSALDFSVFSSQRPLRLLDLGCGLGMLLDWLAETDLLDRVDYTGVDLSAPIIETVRKRWPNKRIEFRDVRDSPFPADAFDFCIACGIFTSKDRLSHHEKVALAQDMLKAVWPSVTFGLSFNSMSKHVDWERDDLFHWPLDDIMSFCKRDLSRHVSFKLDYGLWEVSTFVRKEPSTPITNVPKRW